MGNSHCCTGSASGQEEEPYLQAGPDYSNDGEIDPSAAPGEPTQVVTSCCVSCFQPEEHDEAFGGSGASWVGRGRRLSNPGGGIQEDFLSEEGKEGVLSPSSIGTVVKARHRQTSMVHALRQISKKKLQGGGWKDEMSTLRQLDHPHIVKLHETWEDALSVYMIMEYCKGGNLTDLCSNLARFNESSIAVLVEQMVDAVSHLHEHRLVHSDLRPENWLFGEQIGPSSSALDMSLKMIDFGFASKHGKKGRRSFRENLSATAPNSGMLSPTSDAGGSKEARQAAVSTSAAASLAGASAIGAVRRLFCQSPEQTTGGLKDFSGADTDAAEACGSLDAFGDRADCWALGVIAYFMLSGQSPFPMAGSAESDLSFQNARFVFMPTNIWRPVSAEAKHFIALCLQREPGQRPSAKQLLSLPWMQLAKSIRDEEVLARGDDGGGNISARKLTASDPPLPTAGTILTAFEHMRRLQLIERAAIVSAAFRVPPEDMNGIWKALEDKDERKSGSLLLKDLLQVLQQNGVACQDLAQMAEEGDLNGTCDISYANFMEDLREFQRNTQDNAMWEVFARFNADSGGRVKKTSLVKALSDAGYGETVAAKFPQLSMERVLANLEGEGQTTLGFEEFRHVFMNQANRARRNSTTRFAK